MSNEASVQCADVPRLSNLGTSRTTTATVFQEIIQLHVSCPSDKEEEKSPKDDYENEEKKDRTPRKMLSRDSSQEYTDSTGIDVHEFLVNTLKNNPRDRMMLLKLEQDILEFINDDNNQYKKFPQMTSYHRMLLHRVAAYFGMDHNVDQTGKAVIINKTGNTRIPEQRFSEHIKDERNMDFQKKFILKRDDASMDKDDNQIRVPLQDGRRSKSIEEREEEYQRVRDRIFAREVSCLGNRESSSRASSSRQSSTDSDMKCLEPRPWSSTDSDSSNRTLRPPVTKASSFSGISILTRGDSLGSKGSQGSARGSRTGTEPTVNTIFLKGPIKDSNEHGLSQPLLFMLVSHSGYFCCRWLVMYVWINRIVFCFVGLPLVTPDVCTPVPAPQPNRGLLPNPAQPPSQQPQPPPQPALLPTPTQHPMGNHLMAQPVASLQPSPQPVSYPSPSCPQVLLPVSPPQQYNMGDELTSQFGQMTLSRQGSSEAPEPPPMYQPQPTVLSQHPPPQTGYIMAPGGQPMPPPSAYQPTTAHPHPPPPPPTAQPVMQAPPPPQSYMQAPPPQQVLVSYYPAGQYPSSGQQYRPMSHQVSYPPQRSQPMAQPTQQSAALQTMVPSQQPAYQGMIGVQQPQNPGILNSQRTGMGGQMQGMMVQYPPMPSYQVPVANESQQVVQQQYQQPVMVPASQSVQGPMPGTAMPVYYSVLTPTQQNSTSPSVGYLQPPSSDQYQITQSPSPCNPQQMQQQYSGVQPPGPGVMVMQLSVPNGPQPAQNPPMVQWNPCKYYSLDQRPSKPGELYKPDSSQQASTQLSSPLASPTQSPTQSPSSSVNSVCPGLGHLPLISQFSRPGGPAQGIYTHSCGLVPTVRSELVPLLCPQVQAVMKHGARGKRQTLKSASTDLGTTDVVVSRVLEVTDLPEGISRPEAEKLFNQLFLCGAKIQWLKDPQGPRGSAAAGAGGGKPDCSDPAHLYTVVAVFPSTMAAQSASFKLNNSGGSLFKLRAAKKNYDLRVLERASSQ
uniref:R3H domain containing 2 n=1 Tax=Denticeps clupeoides TaxID=299321 RepID=A0AAY4AV92_9TELE